MSDIMAGADSRPPAPNPVEPEASPANIAPRLGHEAVIAQPSTFLLPRGQNRAMAGKPLSPLDKDQLQGLVSGPRSLSILLSRGGVQSDQEGHDIRRG